MTIRSRAPLRLGLAGGGTDLPPFCDTYGGAVINCTIDRYAYAFIAPRSDGKVVFEARDMGSYEVHSVGEEVDPSAGLRLHRGVYNHFLRTYRDREPLAVTVTTTVDAPAGSGLGSSSALVVALCEAFRVAYRAPLGLYELAHLAFQIERIDLKLAGGKQDQYAAAFGGMNFIEFLAEDRVIVNPLRVERAILNEIETSLVICFTGLSRSSDEIIRQQTSRIREHDEGAIEALLELKSAAIGMKQAILTGRISDVEQILNASWNSKRRTSNAISTDFIEDIFAVGRKAGAKAGKISGAGGGGFIMFLVEPEDRIKVIGSLNQAGSVAGPVHLTSTGVEAWQQPGSQT